MDGQVGQVRLGLVRISKSPFFEHFVSKYSHSKLSASAKSCRRLRDDFSLQFSTFEEAAKTQTKCIISKGCHLVFLKLFGEMK